MSVCTGAFVLAAAGLLDGRRATTHWRHAAELARRYPDIDVDANVLYVDEGSVLTSAGTASGIDLCLHILREEHGAAVANAVARRMVVPPHRDGGQAQYIEAPMVEHDRGDDLAVVLDWVQAHLNQPFGVEHLARRANMSLRTFNRRFTATTGTAPHRWLTAQRVALAQRLLEETDLDVEQVAEQSGFGTAATLRQHFARHARHLAAGVPAQLLQGARARASEQFRPFAAAILGRVGDLAAVFGVIAGSRTLLRVGCAYALFILTEYAVWIAMLVYAYQQGGATTAGLVVVAQTVPPSVLAPFIATIADRRSPATLLIGGYVVQALAMATPRPSSSSPA